MARKASKPPPLPGKSRHASRVLVVGGVIVLVAGAVIGGMLWLRRGLMSKPKYAQVPAKVVLKPVPDWLPEDIAQSVLTDIQAVAEGRSVFEDDLAGEIYAAAAANVWVSKVARVSKHKDGQVFVEANFRKPYLLVRVDGDLPAIVDREGVVLPLPVHRVPPYSLIIVGGVVPAPTKPGEKWIRPKPGQTWPTPDFLEGLKLRKLIGDRPFVREVTLIDVRNHGGRIDRKEPDLLMVSQLGRGKRTTVKFGRFPTEGIPDYCNSPEQKLKYLDAYVKGNGGRLSGTHTYIDVRYEKLYGSLH